MFRINHYLILFKNLHHIYLRCELDTPFKFHRLCEAVCFFAVSPISMKLPLHIL